MNSCNRFQIQRNVILGILIIFLMTLGTKCWSTVNCMDSETEIFSTFFGSSGQDWWGCCMAIDASGNIVVAGSTTSRDFPMLNAYQENHAGGEYDVFIAKFSPDGQSLLFATYFGGSGEDHGWDVAVDTTGNIVVTGYTDSTDLPTMNAYQENNNGSWDAFIFKLSADGQSLLFTTYFGGSDNDWGHGLGIDHADSIVIAGMTTSSDFPTLNDIQGDRRGSVDAFVARFSADGQSLIFATYLGGNGEEEEYGVAFDAMGNVVVTGLTTSSNFPRVNAYQQNYGGGFRDVFVTKLSADGQSLIFSTFLGGLGEECGLAVGVDSMGNVVVTGMTRSTNFPTVNAFQGSHNGRDDVFISKFGADGQSLIFSTYFGGSSNDQAMGVAFDNTDNVLITGETSSSNLPIVNATQSSQGGLTDVFVTMFSSDGQALNFSTYLSGRNADQGRDVAADATGKIIVAGTTTSNNFPTRNAYQGSYGGNGDIFICKFVPGLPITETTSTETTSTETGTSYPTNTETTGSESAVPTPGFEIIFITLELAFIAILTAKRKNKK
ncbi:MAG: SBBP repeat-containing protein [Candidatus Hodarchaeota archaeon]